MLLWGLRHYGVVSSAIYFVVGALKLDEALSNKIKDIINIIDTWRILYMLFSEIFYTNKS